MSRARALREGVLASIPILPGIVPFGLAYGVAAADAGFTAVQGTFLSALVFAGAAQLAVVELFRTGGGFVALAVSVAAINLRLALYAASLAPHFRSLSGRWRTVLAVFITDPVFALSIDRIRDDGVAKRAHWFYLGTGFAFWSTWTIFSAVGLLVGAGIPAAWQVDFVIPLGFLGLLIPRLQHRRDVTVAVGAGIATFGGLIIAGAQAIVVGVLAGVALGLALHRRQP